MQGTIPPNINDDEVAKLLHFDTMAIDLLDPSLLQNNGEGNGYDIAEYEGKKIPQYQIPIIMKLRGQEKTHSSVEMMNIKLMHRGNLEYDLGDVRLEVTSDNDIFFHYVAK